MTEMDPLCTKLISKYNEAPNIFQATKYWEYYVKKIFTDIESLDSSNIRSGKYHSFIHFGFNETIYKDLYNMSIVKRLVINLMRMISSKMSIYPYSLNLHSIRRAAYRHCELYGELTGSKSIKDYSTSKYGNPSDLFEINGNLYTMQSLNSYIRYSFINKHVNLTGNEIIVELGSGAGHNIELIKKLHPNITVLIFDLPAQLYLSNLYLTNAIGNDSVVPMADTIEWNNLDTLQQGKIHFFGNWQIPLLMSYKFDLFMNAASFGEMEKSIVKNYLSYILGNAKKIYLLNAKKGKETLGKNTVSEPIQFKDYQDYLVGYKLVEEDDAYYAHKIMDMSGGYFQAIWELT
jgi:putative sugar O-methyltransferase